MMGRTDRHARRLLRLFAKDVLLYTEMIVAQAIILSDNKREQLLGFSEAEQPVALQLGGSSPDELAKAAAIGAEFGYSEINLNVGCPSKQVKHAHFGACLMKEPVLVKECIAAISESSGLPVSIKCRIGVDEEKDYDFLERFVGITSLAPCDHFIVHARIALLNGISPKQNRHVPPLRYSEVYRLKKAFPELNIVINGGIRTCDQVGEHLAHVDGVMIGREAYHNPYILALLQQQFCSAQGPLPAREALLKQYLPYVTDQLNQGIKLHRISRHLLGLFQHCPNSRSFRRHISRCAHLSQAKIEVIEQAVKLMQTESKKRIDPTICSE